MDALTCRSPARCRTCEHFQAGACLLEAELEATLAALARRPRPATVRAPAPLAATA